MHIVIANNKSFNVRVQDFEKAKKDFKETSKKKYFLMWKDMLDSFIVNTPSPRWNCDKKAMLLLAWYYLDQNKGFHYAKNSYSALVSLLVFLDSVNIPVSELLVE